MKPIYKHDCSACRFLGTAFYNDRHYDLYCCVNLANPDSTDIIARYSSVDSQYCSAAVCTIQHSEIYTNDHPIKKGYDLAIEQMLALDFDSLKRLKDNLYLTEDILSASKFVDAASTFINSVFVASPRSLLIAARNIRSNLRGYEDDERELINIIAQYLENKYDKESK